MTPVGRLVKRETNPDTSALSLERVREVICLSSHQCQGVCEGVSVRNPSWLERTPPLPRLSFLSLTLQTSCGMRVVHGHAGVPAAPRRAYARSGWVSWEHWLGRPASALPWEEARRHARRLQLRSTAQWTAWCRSDAGRAICRDLRLPARPDVVYASRGWISWYDWLGCVPHTVGRAHRQRRRSALCQQTKALGYKCRGPVKRLCASKTREVVGADRPPGWGKTLGLVPGSQGNVGSWVDGLYSQAKVSVTLRLEPSLCCEPTE